MKRLCRFIEDEDAATATEYAVMLGLIIVVSITAISLVGQKVEAMFTRLATEPGLDVAG